MADSSLTAEYSNIHCLTCHEDVGEFVKTYTISIINRESTNKKGMMVRVIHWRRRSLGSYILRINNIKVIIIIIFIFIFIFIWLCHGLTN
jgi:small nuclear ribonucleoprotein (snRNP)-like protein